MLESDLKREMVRTLLKEGSFARRIEDKWAIGTLDLLIVTKHLTLYADVKMMKDIVTLPATKKQCDQICLLNNVGNPRARACIIGYRDGRMGLGLPGERWDAHQAFPWPWRSVTGQVSFAHALEFAVHQVFAKQEVDDG
jgi:hypothetical protein